MPRTVPDAAALKEYAKRHGLSYETGKRITMPEPFATMVASDHSLTGALPGGIEGTIALQTYSTQDDTSIHETFCVTEIPESIAFLPKLYCRDASYKRTRSYTLGTEGFTSDYRGTEFESEAVNRTWAVQVATDQDEGWLRELFAPTFLDWLGQRSPQDFTFQLIEGNLTCRVSGAVDDAAGLDRLCELTAHVAERIRTESLEEERPGAAFSAPLPLPEQTRERIATDRAVAKRDWDEPPKDMMSAVTAYEKIAAREPGGWKPAILLGGGIGLLVMLFTVPFAFVFGDFGGVTTAVSGIVIGVLLGWFLFWVARKSQVQKRAHRYGQRAFAQQYAASRDLEHEDPTAFHARFLRLDLPGPARNVMFGRPAGIAREARVLLCSDPSGTSAGFEVVVIPAPDGTAGAPASPAGDDSAKLELQGGYLVVYRPVQPGTGPTLEGLDSLARRADEATAALARS
jgi:hypothetical protein